MKKDLPIVVAAYNRPHSLQRLLISLEIADYPENIEVKLIISIDHSGSDDCKKVAENFEWKYGKKMIIAHEKNLGLRDHIIKCGDISQDYDGIIMLEDDLVVSPSFYHFALSSLNYYYNNDKLAGISLYSYEYNEFCHLPFNTIKDNYDCYFMKVPSSCGQIYSKKHWAHFKESLDNKIVITNDDYLPDQVFNWPESSWKKLYFKHMVDNELYFVYPNISFSSNMGDEGTHFGEPANFIRTNITIKTNNFNFPELGDTVNVYDQFMELDVDNIKIKNKKIKALKKYEIDTFGFKPKNKITKKNIITSRKVLNYSNSIPVVFHPVQYNLLVSKSFISNEDDFSFNVTELENIDFDSDSFLKMYYSTCITNNIKNYITDKCIKIIRSSKSYKIGNLIVRLIRFGKK